MSLNMFCNKIETYFNTISNIKNGSSVSNGSHRNESSIPFG